jgi:hypothetical protein
MKLAIAFLSATMASAMDINPNKVSILASSPDNDQSLEEEEDPANPMSFDGTLPNFNEFSMLSLSASAYYEIGTTTSKSNSTTTGKSSKAKSAKNRRSGKGDKTEYPSSYPSQKPSDIPSEPPSKECFVLVECNIYEVCVANRCLAKGDPRFTLAWTGDDDLDLHVITPGGAHIYYSNPEDGDSGGMLDHDDIPGEIGDWVENIVFPMDGSAPPGTYFYSVVEYRRVGTEGPEGWVLSAWVGDTKVAEISGSGSSSQYEYTRPSAAAAVTKKHT